MQFKNKFWRLALLGGWIFFLTSFTWSGVEVKDRGIKIEEPSGGYAKWADKNGLKRKTQVISMNTGKTTYSLRYAVFFDPSGKKIWGPGMRVALSGLGLGPNTGNWYGNGFIDLLIDGKQFMPWNGEIKVISAYGNKGIVDVTWKTTKADVMMRFLVKPDDDKIFLEITLEPKVKINSWAVRLLNSPHYFGKERETRIATSLKEKKCGEQDKTVSLNPASEYWIYYYDNKYKTLAAKKGPSAMLYPISEPEKASVWWHEANIYTKLEYPAEIKKARFLFWQFPNGFTPEDGIKYMKVEAEKALKELKEENFKEERIEILY